MRMRWLIMADQCLCDSLAVSHRAALATSRAAETVPGRHRKSLVEARFSSLCPVSPTGPPHFIHTGSLKTSTGPTLHDRPRLWGDLETPPRWPLICWAHSSERSQALHCQPPLCTQLKSFFLVSTQAPVRPDPGAMMGPPLLSPLLWAEVPNGRSLRSRDR